MRLLVPSYSYPSPTTFWDAIVAGAPSVKYMIANPASGPGTTTDTNYTAAIVNAQAAGITILGYVSTGYATGAPSPATIETSVDLWATLYGIHDIFFDETSSLVEDVPFYAQICNYVHAAAVPPIVVLNPGVVPDPGYLAIADIVVVYEGVQVDYAAFSPPSWVTDGTHRATQFCNIIHTCTSENLAATITKAEAVNAGYIYVSDDVMPNPYKVLPTYLATELSSLPHLADIHARQQSIADN